MTTTNQNAKLILVRGLPGSGKSTLAKAMIGENADAHYEADMFFVKADGTYKFNKMQLGFAHKWCQKKTRESLESGQRVVVSNTFVQIREMNPYLEIAKELGVPFQVVTLTSNWGSIHDVPEQTIELMKKRWEDYETANS
jgi:predicted kinase